MSKMIPIRDLKDTANISNMVKETAGPVYVTKNGYEEMVLLSVDEYEKIMVLNEVYGKLLEAERDFAEGRVRDYKDVMADMRKRYGLQD